MSVSASLFGIAVSLHSGDSGGDGLLPAAHLALLLPFVQVVIPQKVQHRVDGEVAHLPLDGVAKLLGLRGGTLQRDAHIPQGAQPRAGVDVLRPVLGRRTGGEVEHGETEHIRGLINIPAGLVDGLDALVIGDQDVDFTGNRNFFRFQRGVDAYDKVSYRFHSGCKHF